MNRATKTWSEGQGRKLLPALFDKLKDKKPGKREPIGNQPKSRLQDSDSMLRIKSDEAADMKGDADRRGSLGTPLASRHGAKRTQEMTGSPSADMVVSMPISCTVTFRAPTNSSASKSQQVPLQSLFVAPNGGSGAPVAATNQTNVTSLL